MTDRPILFSGPMVRALLAGRKTQTRRVLTQRNVTVLGEKWGRKSPWAGLRFGEASVREGSLISGAPDCHLAVPFCHPADAPIPTSKCAVYRVRPVTQPGDRLYVREAIICAMTDQGVEFAAFEADEKKLEHAGTGWHHKRRYLPGMHMHRWASRLTLTVTEVRIQRLQDIDQLDAEAEGVRCDMSARSFVDHYQQLWDRLNAKRGFGWSVNPWVIATSFDVARHNIDVGVDHG